MSLLDSLLVSIFGMLIVFIVLVILMLIVRLQSAIINMFASKKTVMAASLAGEAPAAAAFETVPAAVQEPAAVQSSPEPANPKVETAVRTRQDSAVVRYAAGTMGSRKYNAFINGKTFELEVEEVKGDVPVKTAENSRIASETIIETKPVTVIKPAPQPESKPTVAQPAVPAAASGDEVISAPVPGMVLDIKTSVGAKVKRGEVLLLIEAMKMENEIVAAKDGAVTEILVTKGASVGMGTPLVVLH